MAVVKSYKSRMHSNRGHYTPLDTVLHSLSFARHLMTCCEKISKFLFLSWLILETDFTLKIRKETSKWPLSPRLSLLSLAQWQGSSGEANRDFCLLFSVVHIHKFVAC